MSSFATDVRVYAGRIRLFSRTDWLVYGAWVGLMSGLVVATGGFLLFGWLNGVQFPEVAWLVPIGAFIFSLAIAFDTIGHRTVYKDALSRGEALVHHVTIFNGIGSCVLLCLAYPQRLIFAIPAMVLTFLSVFYSMVDEAMHWHRYMTQKSDRVEMWSHVFIFVGHLIMMSAWWVWYFQGYGGVAETLAAFEAIGS